MSRAVRLGGLFDSGPIMAIAIFTSFGQQSDSNGVPLNAGTVTVYAATTTTPLSLYSDSALTAGVTNPVTLLADGRHAITYIATASYKIVVKNSAGATIYTRDNIDPGVAVGSGALPVANGGTAATTAAGARTNLAAAAASDIATIQSDLSSVQTYIGYNLTTSTRLASGTTAQRDAVPLVGMVRENSTTTKVETYINSGWDNVMLETANSASAADVLAETAGVLAIRADRLSSSKRVGRCAALVNYSGGVPALTNGYGFTATVADNATGDFTLNFSVAEADTNYAVFAQPFLNATVLYAAVTAKSTTQVRVAVNNSAGSATDPTSCSVMVMRLA